MDEAKKQRIIEVGKDFFRKTIIPNHLKKISGLKLKDFDINPFLVNYIASLLCGNTSPQSLSKAILYPRILGTSITTSFGSNLQYFISAVAAEAGKGSGIDGIDIEFVDALDGRTKYCQCKAGPKTINHDDVATIQGHFIKLQNKARLDHLGLNLDDMIVGVLYGDKSNLSANYKRLMEYFPVYCGVDFWEHITGDKDFYYRLSSAFGQVVEEDHIDGCQIILDKVNDIAREISEKGGL